MTPTEIKTLQRCKQQLRFMADRHRLDANDFAARGDFDHCEIKRSLEVKCYEAIEKLQDEADQLDGQYLLFRRVS